MPTTRAFLQAHRQKQRDARRIRLMMIIDALRDLGKPIDDQIAPALASDEAVGRPHIARAMVAAGHVESVAARHSTSGSTAMGRPTSPRQGHATRERAIDAITRRRRRTGARPLPGSAGAARR